VGWRLAAMQRFADYAALADHPGSLPQGSKCPLGGRRADLLLIAPKARPRDPAKPYAPISPSRRAGIG